MPNEGANSGAANSEAGKGANEQGQAGQSNTGGAGSSSSSSSTDAGKPGSESGKTDEKAGEKAGDGAAAGKTGDQGGDNSGGKAGDSKETPKAPDKYELTVPDAQKGYIDGDTLKEFEGFARSSGMTNDEAQAFLEDRLAFAAQRASKFLEVTKAHPDYGGDKLEETQRLARKAIDRVRPAGHPMRDGFLAFLNGEGAGNHIQAVSFLADLGRMMGEDTPPQGKGGSGKGSMSSNEEKASKLYDHPTSKAAAGG